MRAGDTLFQWSTALLVIDFVTIAFFVTLFQFLKPHISFLLPFSLELGLYFFVGFVALTTFIQEQEVTKSFRKSSFAIAVVSLFRICEVTLRVYFPFLTNEWNTVLQLPFVLLFWVLFLASREYFEADLASPDPRNLVPSPKLRQIGKGENHPLINADYSLDAWPTTRSLIYPKKEKEFGLMQVEVLCLIIQSVAGAVQAFVLFFTKDWSGVNLVNNFAIWVQVVSCGAYVLIKIVQMQTLSLRGVFFGTSHSDGFVWALLLFGTLVRILFDVCAQIIVPKSRFGTSSFVDLGKEVITQVIPYTFHLYNIRQRKIFSKNQSQVCDSAARGKLCFYLVVTSLHLGAVGYVLEFDDNRSPLLISAHVAGLVASLDLCFVATGFMAPIFSFATHLLSFGIIQHSSRKIHFHRNMAVSACVFFFLHAFFHVLCWGLYNDSSLRNSHGIPDGVYGFRHTPFLTGIVMLVCFFGALITGIIIKRRKPSYLVLSLHIPFSCVGFIAFSMHGDSNLLNHHSGGSLCLAVFIISVGTILLYFVFLRIRELEVEKILISKEYIFMVAKYSDSKYIVPGSFFNIYANSPSYLSLFHSHSFSVLSTAHSQVAFLIQRRRSANSFTSKFALANVKSIRVQGPFKGPSRSFVLSLRSVSFRNARKCVFMVGWKAGFSSVFSLLEYFKDAEPDYLYNLNSINCIFLKIDDDTIRAEIHVLVENLVNEWHWETPLSIIEAQNEEELYNMTDSHVALHGNGLNKAALQDRFPRKKIWFAVKNKDDGIQNKNLNIQTGDIFVNSSSASSFSHSSGSSFPLPSSPPAPTAKCIDCTMAEKWIYFCGGNFPYDIYKEPKWHPYVESL